MEFSTRKKFDRNWWYDFQKNSSEFNKPHIKDKVLSAEEITRLKNLTKDVVKQICTSRSLKYGFRAWVDNEQKNIHYIRRNVFDRVEDLEGLDLEQWGDRIFSKKDFCFVVNHANRFSDELTQILSKYISPLVQYTGIPMDGMHIGLIIGKYGYTPFGIHQDPEGSYFFNFHLGPSEKLMYTWNEETYNELHGTQNNINVEPFLSSAKVFRLMPGSLYFMPYSEYHIAKANDFSISLSVWFDNHSLEYVAENIFFDILKGLPKGKSVIPALLKKDDYISQFQNIENYLFGENFEDQGLKAFFQRSYKERMLRLFSNGGWTVGPTERKLQSWTQENLFNSTVQKTEPFEVHWLKDGLDLKIFARGHQSVYIDDGIMVSFMESLNSGIPISLSKWVNKSNQDAHFKQFLIWLYINRAYWILKSE